MCIIRASTPRSATSTSAGSTRRDQATRLGFSLRSSTLSRPVNGYQDSERRSIDRVIDDRFALLQHGQMVTATGNSDTHHLDHNIGGYPRNYVRVQE